MKRILFMFPVILFLMLGCSDDDKSTCSTPTVDVTGNWTWTNGEQYGTFNLVQENTKVTGSFTDEYWDESGVVTGTVCGADIDMKLVYPDDNIEIDGIVNENSMGGDDPYWFAERVIE